MSTYFKDSNNEIHVLEQEHIENGYVQKDFKKITKAEYIKLTEVTPDMYAFKVRSERSHLLERIDKVASNPLWYNSLSKSEKEDLANYRQELLDITQTEGFPENVDFPVQPQILARS